MTNEQFEFEYAVQEYLKANLRLNVKTDSVYNGGMDGGQMYNNYHTVQLVLDGEVISEVTLS